MNNLNEQEKKIKTITNGLSMKVRLLIEFKVSLYNCHEMLSTEKDIMDYCEQEICNQLSSDGYTSYKVISKKMDEISTTSPVEEDADDPFFTGPEEQIQKVPTVLMELSMSIKSSEKDTMGKDEIIEYALIKLSGYEANIKQVKSH